MAKIYSLVDGNTLGAHKIFLERLTKRGAQIVDSLEQSDAIVVFCPITSRCETDLNSALSKLPECEKVILVAMHHTFNPDFTTPERSQLVRPVTLTVNCLFHEKKGLFKCAKNKTAIDSVCKELDLKQKLGWPKLELNMGKHGGAVDRTAASQK